MNESRRRMVVDVDVGTDDAWALLVLLHADKIGHLQIEAITCCAGNTSVDQVCINVVRLLQAVGREDIPVYKGAREALVQTTIQECFHGIDGLGDLQYDRVPDMSGILKDVTASTALADIVRKHPKQVELVCLAPLTNVALALKMYDDFEPNLKEVWIMGGNHTGVGNATASAEYNFFFDPEAAYIVLESIHCPIHILPWEPCLLPEISLDWRIHTIGTIKSPVIQWLTHIERKVYVDKTSGSPTQHWVPCDAFLAFALLQPDNHVERKSKYHVTVELRGAHTRGQLVLDHLRRRAANVTLIEAVNTEEFKKLITRVAREITGSENNNQNAGYALSL